MNLKDLGNCGYSARTTKRNKGYATEMLNQICEKARIYGLKQLLLEPGGIDHSESSRNNQSKLI